MAEPEADIHALFEQNMADIIRACLRPMLRAEQIDNGLALMDIVPDQGRTSYRTIFNSLVYRNIDDYAVNRYARVNQAGENRLQLAYMAELPYDYNINREVRDLFAVYLQRASYEYRRLGHVDQQQEAERIVEALFIGRRE